jgi:hypothetical protein
MNPTQVILIIGAIAALIAIYLDLRDYYKRKKEKKVSKGNLPLKNRR